MFEHWQAGTRLDIHNNLHVGLLPLRYLGDPRRLAAPSGAACEQKIIYFANEFEHPLRVFLNGSLFAGSLQRSVFSCIAPRP